VCAVAYFVGRDLTAELDHGSLVWIDKRWMIDTYDK
jgi:hypothetical protein